MLCLVAGMILKNKDGKYLVTYRSKKPLGLSFPSFHLASKQPGNVLIDAAIEFSKRAELDIGIKPIHVRRLGSIICQHHCRFWLPLIQIDIHEWIIYEVVSFRGEPHNLNPEKYASIDYLTGKEILSAARGDGFDPVWKNILASSNLKNLISP
ncbi:MAG: hypothetical protein AAB454_01200 [Patescibacteria group bacterium]